MSCIARAALKPAAAKAIKKATLAPVPRRCVAAAATAGPSSSGFLAGALAAAIVVASVPAADAADLVLGANIFNGNCAACHTGGRNSVMPEKTLDKAAIEQYLDGGFNLEAIIYQVENGKGAMPAWADRLSEEEIQAVAEYVYKQASEAAWQY